MQIGDAQDALEYTGKRIHLSSAKVVSESKKFIKISVIVSNTGKKDVRLFDDVNRGLTTFTYGISFEKEKIKKYKADIIDRVLGLNTIIQKGQLHSPKAFKIRKNKPEKDQEPVLFAEKKKEDLPESEMKSTPKPEPKSTPESAPIALQKPKTKPEPKRIPESTPITHHEKTETKKGQKNKKILSPIGVLPKPEKKDVCFDLVIDNLRINKKSKKNIYVTFDLVNYGQGVFTFDRKNQRLENLSIKAFFASIPRLTRGSLIAGGAHFDEIFDEKKFSLGFGQSTTGTLKIPLELMTKWTPVVILELDPFSTVIECDKVNNVNTVLWNGQVSAHKD